MRGITIFSVASVLVMTLFSGMALADSASNKEIVITGMKGVFIDHDPAVAEKLWDDTYIQHNPLFPNGKEVVVGFAKNPPPGFKYEMGMVVAEDDIVMVRGRYTGFGPKPFIAVDTFRVKNGKIVEHWDVLQEEVPAAQTKSGNPMFEPGF